MDKKTITISSAVNLNNYSEDILFTLKDKNKGLFVGKKEFYAICKKLNIKYYNEVEETDNKTFYKLEENHKKKTEVE